MKKNWILAFLLGITLFTRAQELDATVTVTYQNLPVVNKENLGKFADEIQNYLNTTRFTGNDWRYAKIKCSFNISITSAESEVAYTGQAVVISQRMIYHSKEITPILRIMDNTWNFTYERNQQFYYNASTYNSLLSFFDYYAFIIIGLEADSWEKLSGTQYFNKASDIMNIARSSSQAKGWETGSGSYNRRDMVENLLTEKYRAVREGFADYHYAIDLIAQRPANLQKREIYLKNGQDRIVAFIKSMDAMRAKFDINAVFVRAFFDAKHAEIIEKLRTYPDKNIFKTLKLIDPAHTSKYDDAFRN